jgi:hypothetical protein
MPRMGSSTERMRRLRERRAAALMPVDGPGPQDADTLLVPAVEQTLQALQLGERGAAAGALALEVARAIDGAENQPLALVRLGPVMLKVLQALEATPASRVRERPGPRRPNQLDRLRAAHLQHPATRARRGRA